MKKSLELFAGSSSFTKVAQSPKFNFNTYTSDNQSFANIDQICDIFDFNLYDCIKALRGVPDLIWASPPCTYFSVASIGHHWNKDHTPKTEEAKLGVKIVQETVAIIKKIQKFNPDCKYIIEKFIL